SANTVGKYVDLAEAKELVHTDRYDSVRRVWLTDGGKRWLGTPGEAKGRGRKCLPGERALLQTPLNSLTGLPAELSSTSSRALAASPRASGRQVSKSSPAPTMIQMPRPHMR